MPLEPVDIKNSKVLVVDDTPANLDLFSTILENEGLQVSFATNGKQALKLASLDTPDLILLDIMMPEMNGIETCRRLKSIKETRDIPIIFITARTDREYVVEGFNSGGVDYISKPVQQEELCARVRCHLELQALVKLRDDLIESLCKHNEKVETLVKEQRLQLMQAEKLATIGDMVGEFTHEINTPVGIALTTLSYIAEETRAIEQQLANNKLSKQDFNDFLRTSLESSDICNSNLLRAISLINSFKRTAIDQCSDACSDFNLKECLEDVIASIQPKIKHTKHKIELSCEPDITLHNYPGAIAQIVINLINNSILHAYEENQYGIFSITAEQDNQDLVLKYADDGRGVPDETVEKLFEKYYTTRKREGGSGLGLYIVKTLSEQTLNGSLQVKGNPGQGCEFIIRFPANNTDDKDEA